MTGSCCITTLLPCHHTDPCPSGLSWQPNVAAFTPIRLSRSHTCRTHACRTRMSHVCQVYDADLVVCAVGVEPATEWMPRRLRRAPDGGLEVGCVG